MDQNLNLSNDLRQFYQNNFVNSLFQEVNPDNSFVDFYRDIVYPIEPISADNTFYSFRLDEKAGFKRDENYILRFLSMYRVSQKIFIINEDTTTPSYYLKILGHLFHCLIMLKFIVFLLFSLLTPGPQYTMFT